MKLSRHVQTFEKKYNISVFSLITSEDVEEEHIHSLLQFFREKTNENVLLILHVPSGGDTDICSRVCHVISTYPGTVTVFVPEIAFSSGSQIALSGDKLMMGKFACLSPIDDQLDGVPAKQMKKVHRFFHSKSKKSDQTKFHSNLKRLLNLSLEEYSNVMESKKMLDITRKELTNTLKKQYNTSTIKAAIKLFIDHSTHHANPIYAEEIIKTGLVINTNIPKDYYDLFDSLYSECIY